MVRRLRAPYTTPQLRVTGLLQALKNRGSLLRQLPEDTASISSHYTLTSFAYQRYARAPF